jgi:pimeloyl-ACP methyl ester carboxylesterase
MGGRQSAWMTMKVDPFTIDIPESTLVDLRARIQATRWPNAAPGPAWEQGMDAEFLAEILVYWADGFDWRAHERKLNAFPQFCAEIDGIRIHYVHQRAETPAGVPLILTHGWPSSFIEYLALVPLLTDPVAHGIDGPAFDLVIPSLPGYGFSDRPPHINYRGVSDLWHRLMQGLGYERYGAGGGDFGAGVTSVMALDQPDRMIGIHLTTPELSPAIGDGSRPLSDAERAYLTARDAWDVRERGYSSIQSTKPQTLAYALNDSPAGLAAWILEKWRSWADTGGDIEARFGRDQLLTLVTLYWVTSAIATSTRDYFDNRWQGISLGPDDRVRVPTGIANFSHQFVFEGEPPREWAERLYDVRRWTPMPRGGHFAAAEEPDLLARDIAAFFGSL